ncbi:ESX secretion-associated protein EspG [Nocardia panacis]|uniref:ESX secretion-associated protein EspG n=1 Tax=Nocardia panacis TaxID=2340916 RepID=A0A3A4KQ04_9NOCA|nr:ESX secretion-associated protein EspG [Nocardia panacis]RJO75100.1 ESX secretion-associated protein EspG [Nocardia panacis]
MSWRLTDLEFAAAWAELREDYMPSPLTYSAHTGDHDEHERQMFRARAELRDRLGAEEFPYLLREIAHPDIRVSVRGLNGRDAENPNGCVRVLATRKGSRAFLIEQHMGGTIWAATGFTITEYPAPDLAAAIVAALPTAAAGRQPDVVLDDPRDSGLDYEYSQSMVYDNFEDGISARATWFDNATVETVGTIELAQAYSRFGPRGITRHTLHWRDLADDGRYAIVGDHPTVAVGANAKRMVSLINSGLITLVRAIRDDRS